MTHGTCSYRWPRSCSPSTPKTRARSQLLFQRTIPDFEPSPEAYALAEEVFAFCAGHLARAGIADPTDMDLFTALVAGLGLQQSANDPGGDRWRRLLDRAVDMYVREVLGPTSR